MKQEIKEYITEISVTNYKVGNLKLKLEDRNTYVIIQVYAPASLSEDKEIEEFYTTLGETIEPYNHTKGRRIVIMGDFNSQIGETLEGKFRNLPNYCYGRRNEKGWRMLRFC